MVTRPNVYYNNKERDQVLKDFRTGKISIMVATDVAARGLGYYYVDVKDVGLVINYDFPMTIEDYVHRVGRTGRAGARGTAISFFTMANGRLAKDLIQVLKESKQAVPEALYGFHGKDTGGNGRRYGARGYNARSDWRDETGDGWKRTSRSRSPRF